MKEQQKEDIQLKSSFRMPCNILTFVEVTVLIVSVFEENVRLNWKKNGWS